MRRRKPPDLEPRLLEEKARELSEVCNAAYQAALTQTGGDHYAAQDASQDVAIKYLTGKLSNIRWAGNAGKQAAIEAFRRSKGAQTVVSEPEVFEREVPQDAFEKATDRLVVMQLVDWAKNNLTKSEWRAFNKFVESGASVGDVVSALAKQLDLSESTVRAQLKSGFKKISNKFESELANEYR